MFARRLVPLLVVLVLFLSLAACERRSAGQPAVTQPPAPPVEIVPSAPVSPLTATATSAPPALPPDPQPVSFTASDGQTLTGYYYPAAVNPAPLLVFMHWVNGDQSDWYEIAPWLQNRGLANPFGRPGNEAWWDPTWFPPLPADRSYGVFIFSFRSCAPFPQGCNPWSPDLWLLDAQAAIQKALTLEGVDSTRVVAIGSSIGADGAVDACAWLVQQNLGACRGAFSLSPGGYLDVEYRDAVQTMMQADPDPQVWCVADNREIQFCRPAEGLGARLWEIPNGAHGTLLLRPNLNPLPMQLILDFLAAAVGL